MKFRPTFISRLLALVLGTILLAGCTSSQYFTPLNAAAQSAFTADLNTCLGLLIDQVTPEEYAQLEVQFLPLWRLRQSRLAQGKPTMGIWESYLMEQFSLTLDHLTTTSLGAPGSYAADNDAYDLVDFVVTGSGALGAVTYYPDWDRFVYQEDELCALWDIAAALLPAGALSVFDTYSVFTDGAYGTVAYVYWDKTEEGSSWGLALDPADVEDTDYFYETILHEYFHYLSLNDSQVDTSGTPTLDTYFEPGRVSAPDSYVNLFYQAFWSPLLLDERLSNEDSMDFFTRHYDDFYNSYATTDPCEDIAECFSYYVLWSDDWYDAENLSVWEQKICWFDQFPQLRAFRAQVQENLTRL